MPYRFWGLLDSCLAAHAEHDPSASSLFISQLAGSLAGRDMQLNFVPGAQVAAIYDGLSAKEHYYCNFGVNPDCIDALKQGPLNISGSDAEGEIRIIEHPDHPFLLERCSCRKHALRLKSRIRWLRLFWGRQLAVQSDIAVMNPHLVIRNALSADAQNISALIHAEAHYCTVNPLGEGAEYFFSTISPEAITGYITTPNFIYLLSFVGVELAGIDAIQDKGVAFIPMKLPSGYHVQG
jgi:hypothetical protein